MNWVICLYIFAADSTFQVQTVQMALDGVEALRTTTMDPVEERAGR